MRQTRVQPNVVTFNALAFLDETQHSRLLLDVVTLDALASLDVRQRSGLQPDVVTANALASQNDSGTAACGQTGSISMRWSASTRRASSGSECWPAWTKCGTAAYSRM